MSAEPSDIDYGFWAPQDSEYSFKYSLPVFQEIEFLAGEGYRRIPHGGVEVGGLLFGRIEKNEVQIEAFRSIECEHAVGPSFVLSPRDLDVLAKQLESSTSDPELAGAKPLGWFIAHTRSGLQMNERELPLFDRFFPKAGSVTVLVKPERFQPTRFVFLVRSSQGQLEQSAARNAILLPSPGKSAARRPTDGAIPSIPVSVSEKTPEPSKVVSPEKAKPSEVSTPVSAAPSPVPLPEPVVISQPEAFIPERLRPEPEKEPPFTKEAPPELPERVRYTPDFVETQKTSNSVAPPEQNPADETLAAPPPVVETPTRVLPPITIQPEPHLPVRDRTLRHSQWTSPKLPPKTTILHARPASDLRLPNQHVTRRLRRSSGPSRARLAAVLFCAALLGCLVGYYAYAQLPSVIIPLSVQIRPKGLFVSWPADQTRDTAYAAIRVDDGAPVPLSPEEKSAGGTQVAFSRSDTKIELIAQHWLRDSRGIIRFVSGADASSRLHLLPQAEAIVRSPVVATPLVRQ